MSLAAHPLLLMFVGRCHERKHTVNGLIGEAPHTSQSHSDTPTSLAEMLKTLWKHALSR